MKAIAKFIEDRKITKKSYIDSESIFYIIKNVIKVKYGELGSLNIKPMYYKKGIIFLKVGNSNWANELWLNKKIIIENINKKIGEDEVKDIKLQQN